MSRLKLKQVTLGSWQENCYILVCPETQDAALVDPGDEFEKIVRRVGKLRVTKILLTHTDLDHIGALDAAREAFRAPVYVHPAELERPKHPEAPSHTIEGTRPLHEGQHLRIGTHYVTTYEVPGHSPGHVAFRFDERALVGDAIFPGGPGRTHSPAALSEALYNLQRVVFRWEDNTKLYSGHGRPTTVGNERDNFMRFLARPRPDNLFGDVSWA
jgi:hydroxyacylglutathione hydrolase